LRGLGRDRAAKTALRNGWKTSPHPLIAAAYMAPIPTAIERAQAAQTLAAANPGHGESSLIMAETALAADLPGEARRHAQAAIAAGLNDPRPHAILAALGETTTPASPASAWTCEACHTISPEWHPICPHCQKLGQLAWQKPGTALALLA
jgi:HemY protein